MNAEDKNYDLHSHSTASDGELTPAELVKHAAEKGVQVLALTDHDVTDGLSEARAAADACGIELINGVEISVTWNKKLVHIVGLKVDPQNAALQAGLVELRHTRDGRSLKIAERLAKMGVEGALAGAQAYANGKILSRTHFAQFLLAQGYVKTMQGAFDKYIGEGKKGYAAGEWTSLADAVSWINGAGGVAVIAHPARYQLSATKLRELCGEFKELGGVGIEVVSGKSDPLEVRNMGEYAQRFELAASMGSDFHGPSQAWLQMGRLPPLPKACRPVWQCWS